MDGWFLKVIHFPSICSFIYKTIKLIKTSDEAVHKVLNLTVWHFGVTQARPKAQKHLDICYEN